MHEACESQSYWQRNEPRTFDIRSGTQTEFNVQRMVPTVIDKSPKSISWQPDCQYGETLHYRLSASSLFWRASPPRDCKILDTRSPSGGPDPLKTPDSKRLLLRTSASLPGVFPLRDLAPGCRQNPAVRGGIPLDLLRPSAGLERLKRTFPELMPAHAKIRQYWQPLDGQFVFLGGFP